MSVLKQLPIVLLGLFSLNVFAVDSIGISSDASMQGMVLPDTQSQFGSTTPNTLEQTSGIQKMQPAAVINPPNAVVLEPPQVVEAIKPLVIPAASIPNGIGNAVPGITPINVVPVTPALQQPKLYTAPKLLAPGSALGTNKVQTQAVTPDIQGIGIGKRIGASMKNSPPTIGGSIPKTLDFTTPKSPSTPYKDPYGGFIPRARFNNDPVQILKPGEWITLKPVISNAAWAEIHQYDVRKGSKQRIWRWDKKSGDKDDVVSEYIPAIQIHDYTNFMVHAGNPNGITADRDMHYIEVLMLDRTKGKQEGAETIAGINSNKQLNNTAVRPGVGKKTTTIPSVATPRIYNLSTPKLLLAEGQQGKFLVTVFGADEVVIVYGKTSPKMGSKAFSKTGLDVKKSNEINTDLFAGEYTVFAYRNSALGSVLAKTSLDFSIEAATGTGKPEIISFSANNYNDGSKIVPGTRFVLSATFDQADQVKIESRLDYKEWSNLVLNKSKFNPFKRSTVVRGYALPLGKVEFRLTLKNTRTGLSKTKVISYIGSYGKAHVESFTLNKSKMHLNDSLQATIVVKGDIEGSNIRFTSWINSRPGGERLEVNLPKMQNSSKPSTYTFNIPLNNINLNADQEHMFVEIDLTRRLKGSGNEEQQLVSQIYILGKHPFEIRSRLSYTNLPKGMRVKMRCNIGTTAKLDSAVQTINQASGRLQFKIDARVPLSKAGQVSGGYTCGIIALAKEDGNVYRWIASNNRLPYRHSVGDTVTKAGSMPQIVHYRYPGRQSKAVDPVEIDMGSFIWNGVSP